MSVIRLRAGYVADRSYHAQHGPCLDTVRAFVPSCGSDDAPCRTADRFDRHANDGPAERATVPRRCRTRGATPVCARIEYAARRNARYGDSATKAVQGHPRCHAELDPVRMTEAKFLWFTQESGAIGCPRGTPSQFRFAC